MFAQYLTDILPVFSEYVTDITHHLTAIYPTFN